MVLMKLFAFGLLYCVYACSQKQEEAPQLEDQTSPTDNFDKTATLAPEAEGHVEKEG